MSEGKEVGEARVHSHNVCAMGSLARLRDVSGVVDIPERVVKGERYVRSGFCLRRRMVCDLTISSCLLREGLVPL